MKTYTYDKCLSLTIAAGRVPMPPKDFIKLLMAHGKLQVTGEITTRTEKDGKTQKRTRYAGEYIVEADTADQQDISSRIQYPLQRISPDAITFARGFRDSKTSKVKVTPRSRLIEGRNVYWVQRRLSAPHLTTAQEGSYQGNLSASHEGRFPWDTSVTEQQHMVRTSLIHLNGGYNYVVTDSPVDHHHTDHSSIKAAPEEASTVSVSVSTPQPMPKPKRVKGTPQEALQALIDSGKAASLIKVACVLNMGYYRMENRVTALGWLKAGFAEGKSTLTVVKSEYVNAEKELTTAGLKALRASL